MFSVTSLNVGFLKLLAPFPKTHPGAIIPRSQDMPRYADGTEAPDLSACIFSAAEEVKPILSFCVRAAVKCRKRSLQENQEEGGK